MKSIKPVYVGSRSLEKPNYGPGYVGFSYNDSNLFSYGIVVFTKEETDTISISHSFLVVDSQTVAEATIGGVKLTPISHYFDNPHYAVFFKKPRDLDPQTSQRLIKSARSRLGRGYDYGLIAHFFLRKFFLYKWISESSFFRKKPSIFDTRDEDLCSEFVCECLQDVERYQTLYPLSEYHTSKIDPLRLFRSDDKMGILEPWNFD